MKVAGAARSAQDRSAFRLAEEAADGSAINVVHLIYKNKPYEGHYKDYEFSIDTMQEHRESGLENIRDSFAHREWFDVPSREQCS
ncbi:patatin [Caballeronia udeis]|uniref:Patatin n=1 Tax=Caballeronia udeis TaxID=1232866 RepID=A0A158J5A9_9BURK|nr:patatin [Caballeronia udeis]